MMSWFLIALAAPFLWSVVNISDQYLVAKYSAGENTSGGIVLFGGFIAIAIAFIIGIFTAGIFQIPILDKLLLVMVGGITIAWVLFYFRALEIGDVSAVVPWFLTVPIFGFVLGYLFLGETLSVQQLLGSLIILLGGFFVLVDFSESKKKFAWKSALYMVVACFLIAAAGIIFKYVTVGGSFWISSFWEYVGFGIFGVLAYFFIPKYRHEFIAIFKKGGRNIIMLTTIIETLTIAGNLLTNFAILLAPVTMVYLVGSFQPAILLCFTLIGTRFFPNIVKEDMSKRVLVPKIIAITVMIAGSAILFL